MATRSRRRYLARGVHSTADGVVISWFTDEPADSTIEFGLSPSQYDLGVYDAALVSSHAIVLTGLLPVTTYHYRIVSRDAAGNPTYSQDYTFSTSFEIDGMAGPGTNYSAVVSWSGALGRLYDVLFARDLTAGVWSNVPETGYSNIAGRSGPMSYTNTVNLGSNVFFRIRAAW